MGESRNRKVAGVDKDKSDMRAEVQNRVVTYTWRFVKRRYLVDDTREVGERKGNHGACAL